MNRDASAEGSFWVGCGVSPADDGVPPSSLEVRSSAGCSTSAFGETPNAAGGTRHPTREIPPQRSPSQARFIRTVTGVGQSSTGNVLFVNFVKKAHAGVTAVYFTSGGRAGNVKSLDELKPFVGKTVTIKGELTSYKDDVQIVLQSVEDLHAVDK